MELEHYGRPTYNKQCAFSHDASTVVVCMVSKLDRRQVLLWSARSTSVTKFLESETWQSSRKKYHYLFSEIPEFPYNTVYGRWRRASVNHLLDSSSRFDTSPVVYVHPSVSTVTFETTGLWLSFLQLDATLVRYMLSARVCPSVCLSQAGIVSKRLDESSWFWARRLRSTCPTLCYKEIGVSPKIRVLPLGLCHKLWTWKISPRKVDAMPARY